MLWHGLPRSGHSFRAGRIQIHRWAARREQFHEYTSLNQFTAPTARQGRALAQWNRRCDPRRADRSLPPLSDDPREEARLRVVALARRAGAISTGQTRLATYRNPDRQFLGRPDCGSSLLGQECGWTEFPGLRYQLRPSRMPGALVSAVEPFHVPVSRRRLLCGWFTRRGSSAARTVSVSAQSRGWKASDQGRRNADDRESHCERTVRGRHALDRKNLDVARSAPEGG